MKLIPFAVIKAAKMNDIEAAEAIKKSSMRALSQASVCKAMRTRTAISIHIPMRICDTSRKMPYMPLSLLFSLLIPRMISTRKLSIRQKRAAAGDVFLRAGKPVSIRFTMKRIFTSE